MLEQDQQNTEQQQQQEDGSTTDNTTVSESGTSSPSSAEDNGAAATEGETTDNVVGSSSDDSVVETASAAEPAPETEQVATATEPAPEVTETDTSAVTNTGARRATSEEVSAATQVADLINTLTANGDVINEDLIDTLLIWSNGDVEDPIRRLQAAKELSLYGTPSGMVNADGSYNLPVAIKAASEAIAATSTAEVGTVSQHVTDHPAEEHLKAISAEINQYGGPLADRINDRVARIRATLV